MYTATITNTEKLTNGGVTVTVEFSDGTNTFTQTYTGAGQTGTDWLKPLIRNTAEVLDKGDTMVADISLGVFDYSDPAPTQAELNMNDWINDYRKWVRIKETLIDTGILDGTQTQLVSLKTKIQSGFKPAYLNYL